MTIMGLSKDAPRVIKITPNTGKAITEFVLLFQIFACALTEGEGFAIHRAMKIEDTALWNDPLVRETLDNVAPDMAALNAVPALKALRETEALDALTLAYLVSETGTVFGTLSPQVEAFGELVASGNLHEALDALFRPENASALRLVMAVLVTETTGEGLEKTQAAIASGRRKDEFRAGMDIMLEIADRLVTSEAVYALPPALVEKFAEGLDNMKPLQELSVHRKVMGEASASLKYAMMQANAEDIAVAAPRIDPESQYAQLKPLARAKLRL